MALDTILRMLVLVALCALPLTIHAQDQQQCDSLYPNAIQGPPAVKGKRFFDSVSGEYIPVKGIAYYPRPNAGELAESDSVDYFGEDYRYIWEPDLENFKELGVNVIRIYAVDPTVDHSAFMCALQQEGIYVIVGLLADCQDCGIGPNTNDLDLCYPASLKTRGQYIIQVFSKYPNVLAFSAGNEVSIFATDKIVAANAPCQKQFVRDMRAYIQDCGIRNIPIGVVTSDPSSENRELNSKYYNCRSDPTDELENAEWYGLNAYQHCNGAAQTVEEMGGYTRLLQDFSSYDLTIPTLISEFGCRSQSFPTIDGFESQRTWLQVDALYSPDYLEVFAGGVAFEYSAEKKVADTSEGTFNPWPYYGHMRLQYGVTYLSPVDCNHNDTRCENIKYPEFDLLADKFRQVNVNLPSMDNYVPPAFPIPECPSSIPPLSDFVWPSASEQDFWCPPEDEVYVCPCGTSSTAQTTLPPTPAPSAVTSTALPTASTPDSSDPPTKAPIVAATDTPPTISNGSSEATDSPVSAPVEVDPSPIASPVPLPPTIDLTVDFVPTGSELVPETSSGTSTRALGGLWIGVCLLLPLLWFNFM